MSLDKVVRDCWVLHKEKVRYFMLPKCKNNTDVEDALQEIYVKF